METQPKGIFESDRMFIGWASVLLLIVGIFSLILILSCRFFGSSWGLCEATWVPLFGGYQLFSEDLASINLPLAMLILGIGLRLPTGFGWSTCMIILSLLGFLFFFMGIWLIRILDEHYLRIASNQIFPEDYPVTESIFTNFGLGIMCLIGIVYLLLPSVRKLYWH